MRIQVVGIGGIGICAGDDAEAYRLAIEMGVDFVGETDVHRLSRWHHRGDP
jgi:hypothetical protein